MSHSNPRHFYIFSHQFEASHFGAARSYWDIQYGTPNSHIKVGQSIEMSDSSAGINVERTLQDICYIMDKAVERGKNIKMGEIQTILGIDFNARIKPSNL